MTAATFSPLDDPWGPPPGTMTALASLPNVGTPELTLLQAAFAAAQRSIPLNGSDPIGGPGSGCTLTGDQLSLLLDEVAAHRYATGGAELELGEAETLLTGDGVQLFELAHGGDVRGFAHLFHRVTNACAPAGATATPGDPR